MSQALVVTGTDTGIGKTVFSAALVQALNAFYWKPIQSGLEEETDSQAVARLAAAEARVLPELYCLKLPASPHRAAEVEGRAINPADLTIPAVEGPLVIEGAGGLLVPLTRKVTFADVFARWQLPTILCARTALGTINHTLLSLEAMRARNIKIMGVAFIGEAVPDTQAVIAETGRVPVLGRLPYLADLAPEALRAAFRKGFDLSQFARSEMS